ncbi:hypothetical protein SNEBB_007059 [Seison nebaliae]|nr:hypothetical protein SNEBB_007059 [Seison nebaliae]
MPESCAILRLVPQVVRSYTTEVPVWRPTALAIGGIVLGIILGVVVSVCTLMPKLREKSLINKRVKRLSSGGSSIIDNVKRAFSKHGATVAAENSLQIRQRDIVPSSIVQLMINDHDFADEINITEQIVPNCTTLLLTNEGIEVFESIYESLRRDLSNRSEKLKCFNDWKVKECQFSQRFYKLTIFQFVRLDLAFQLKTSICEQCKEHLNVKIGENLDNFLRNLTKNRGNDIVKELRTFYATEEYERSSNYKSLAENEDVQRYEQKLIEMMIFYDKSDLRKFQTVCKEQYSSPQKKKNERKKGHSDFINFLERSIDHIENQLSRVMAILSIEYSGNKLTPLKRNSKTDIDIHPVAIHNVYHYSQRILTMVFNVDPQRVLDNMMEVDIRKNIEIFKNGSYVEHQCPFLAYLYILSYKSFHLSIEMMWRINMFKDIFSFIIFEKQKYQTIFDQLIELLIYFVSNSFFSSVISECLLHQVVRDFRTAYETYFNQFLAKVISIIFDDDANIEKLIEHNIQQNKDLSVLDELISLCYPNNEVKTSRNYQANLQDLILNTQDQIKTINRNYYQKKLQEIKANERKRQELDNDYRLNLKENETNYYHFLSMSQNIHHFYNECDEEKFFLQQELLSRFRSLIENVKNELYKIEMEEKCNLLKQSFVKSRWSQTDIEHWLQETIRNMNVENGKKVMKDIRMRLFSRNRSARNRFDE